MVGAGVEVPVLALAAIPQVLLSSAGQYTRHGMVQVAAVHGGILGGRWVGIKVLAVQAAAVKEVLLCH